VDLAQTNTWDVKMTMRVTTSRAYQMPCAGGGGAKEEFTFAAVLSG